MNNDRIKILLKATKSKLLWNGEVVVDIFEQELQLDEDTRVEIENQLVKADIEGRATEQLLVNSKKKKKNDFSLQLSS